MSTAVARVARSFLRRRFADILDYDYLKNPGEGQDWEWSRGLIDPLNDPASYGKPGSWEPTNLLGRNRSASDADEPYNVGFLTLEHPMQPRYYEQPAIDTGELNLVPETGFDEGSEDLTNFEQGPDVMRDIKDYRYNDMV